MIASVAVEKASVAVIVADTESERVEEAAAKIPAAVLATVVPAAVWPFNSTSPALIVSPG